MKTKRILIVDDEIGAARWLKVNLEQTNHHFVVQVENASTMVLATAKTFQPDLVLMDVMMPGLDGGQLYEHFQASPTLKHVPVVFLTAAATKSEVTSRGGRIGGLPFLAKPVDLHEVIACIEKHLVKPASLE